MDILSCLKVSAQKLLSLSTGPFLTITTKELAHVIMSTTLDQYLCGSVLTLKRRE